MIPHFEACLICDFIRPELNGKAIILGFYGVCPNVEIAVQHLDEPLALTFLFTGGGGDGSFVASFDIIDDLNGRVVASAPPMPFQARPASTTSLAATLFAVFGRAGTFAIRCTVDAVERFRAQFRIAQATSPTTSGT